MNRVPILAAALILAPLALHAADKPNIVLILADDLGYECIGANGGTSYKTPHLDKLAATGARFEHCYAQPLCTPTRVQLMTGIYNVRNYTDFGEMDPKCVTFANILKQAGYATCIAGKWQLGTDPGLPKTFGFDEHCLWQHTRAGAGKTPSRYMKPGLEINGVVKDYTNKEYGPDLISDYALDFVQRKKDKPFFLYYTMMLTHAPFDPTPDSSDYGKTKPGSRKTTRPDGANQHFADMVAYADKLVGKLVAKLDTLGLRDNTLVIFLGDNGTQRGNVSYMGGRKVIGGKGLPTDAGMHVPLIVSWPGKAAAGKVSRDLVDSTDFLPTICEAAGAPVPAELKIDGRSFLPQVRGEKGRPRAWYYSWCGAQKEQGITAEFAATRDFKLSRTGEFYDLRSDLEEKNPLKAGQLTSEAAAAAKLLQGALDRYKDARPAALAMPFTGPKTRGKRASGNATQKPNILFIVGDDMGYADVGFHGCKDIPTPNLDALAAAGVRFTNGYVTGPYCSPTRAGLMTGRYQTRFGHEFNPSGDQGLPLTEKTIADRLRAAGYVTGIVGKWHLGALPEMHPQKRGFDEFFGFLAGAHDYFRFSGILRGNEPVEEKEYLTDAFGREAVAFIERHRAGAKPWFLYLAFNAVHTPLQADDARLAKFAGSADKTRRTYAAMMFAMDEAIGRGRKKLADAGLEKNTLVTFISDNGGPTMPGVTVNGSRNEPLRGSKRTTLEGGIRVPFVVAWPGRVKPGVYEKPVIQLDLHVTALAAAGVARFGVPPSGGPSFEEPAKAGTPNLDGVNLLPFLSGEKSGAPHDALYWRFGEQMAIRAGDYKLVRYDSNADTRTGLRQPVSATKLYNLATDIGETKDLAAEQPDKLKELQSKWDTWNATLVLPLWGGGKAGRDGAEPGVRAKGKRKKNR